MKTNIKKMESVEAIVKFIKGNFTGQIITIKTKNENRQEEATLLHAISSSLFYFSKNKKNLSIPVCKFNLSDVPNCHILAPNIKVIGGIVGVDFQLNYNDEEKEFSLFLKEI